MKFKSSLLTLILGVVLSGTVMAQPVEISWSNPDKYRDLRSVVETKTKIQHRFFKEINQHMNKLSEQLPHGYKLTMDVTQVDLAGKIEFVNSQQIRVVKDIFYPNMAFSYQLADESGTILFKDDAQIKGKNFLMNSRQYSSFEQFPHEKKMLTEWFNKEIVTKVTK
ncbi:DUF3016 domain-containing protein [Colwellia sp. MEBiC06753]